MQKPMIKPRRLHPGDKAAIVSLSFGNLGDPEYIHKYYVAKERLERDFGLQVAAMPNALKGSEFIARHPEARAQDLMDAFADPSISAILCANGGNETIRILPYIDFSVIRENPKIFMGCSDTTNNHFMMYKAGLVSFYGPAIMREFGESYKMFDYTVQAVRDLLFDAWDTYEVPKSPIWTSQFVPWEKEYMNTPHEILPDTHGHEVINGAGIARGHLLGGCIESFTLTCGTSIWPGLEEWTGAILFVETSEDKPSPGSVRAHLRNLAAQRILHVINGIIVGKPHEEAYYEEYKEMFHQVVVEEEHLTDLPILYNVNFGHSKPIGVLPYGTMAEIDCEKRALRLLECPTAE